MAEGQSMSGMEKEYNKMKLNKNKSEFITKDRFTGRKLINPLNKSKLPKEEMDELFEVEDS